MKRNYIYIFLPLLLLILSSVIIKDDSKSFKVDGIKYAVSIDGQSSSNFPEKASYDVFIQCSGADAYWNYEDWVAEIYNVTNNVSCNISFTSKGKVYLNNQVISLNGSTVGNGQVVNETASMDNSTFTAGTILAQSDYLNVSNDTTYPFTWDDTAKTWTSANKTHSTTSTITFNVATSGYYQICYNQSSEKNYDYGTFYVDGSSVGNAKGKDGDYCIYLGNLTTSNVVKVTYSKDGSSSSGDDRIVFYLQNGTYNEDIQTVSAGYRYEGKNPNNYIKFNNEMWRIIGVFDETSHGQSGLNLTKIIRNESIGGYAWDKSNKNIWPTSSLYNLLNTYYYNATNGQDSGYCYQQSTTLTGHCDYTNTGIQDNYRPMIKNVTWYLGGYSSNSATTESFFGYERSTSDDNYYTNNTSYKTTTGYIGLMYASDYGYSVLSSSCARTTALGSYSSSSCGGSSWLKKETYEWTITHRTSNSYNVFDVYYIGNLNNYLANYGNATRPVLYLDSSVYIIKGTGTESDPYIIAM